MHYKIKLYIITILLLMSFGAELRAEIVDENSSQVIGVSDADSESLVEKSDDQDANLDQTSEQQDIKTTLNDENDDYGTFSSSGTGFSSVGASSQASARRIPAVMGFAKGGDLFAIKTNMLYDALTMLNLEVEVPITNRFSIAGDFITPTWKVPSREQALVARAGWLEFRVWLGQNRNNMENLTGFFCGVYGGGGLYDARLNGRGYQGEFFDVGATGGFAHSIIRSGDLRLEYSLGIGYMQTPYRYYIGMDDNKYLVWQYDGRFSWFGPTKLEVSLVWMLRY